MPPLSPGAGSGRFIIAGPGTVLGPLLDILGADPSTEVVSVSRTGQGDLRRMVVAMDPARAEALGVALAGLLLVEPDAEVHPGWI